MKYTWWWCLFFIWCLYFDWYPSGWSPVLHIMCFQPVQLGTEYLGCHLLTICIRHRLVPRIVLWFFPWEFILFIGSKYWPSSSSIYIVDPMSLRMDGTCRTWYGTVLAMCSLVRIDGFVWAIISSMKVSWLWWLLQWRWQQPRNNDNDQATNLERSSNVQTKDSRTLCIYSGKGSHRFSSFQTEL